jgi:5-(carboxyamino)imidazole ribonucleotide mutase
MRLLRGSESRYRKIMARTKPTPIVAVIMGSSSDWETARHAVEILKDFGVPTEHRIVSAHRTPEFLAEFGRGAADRGIRVIIAAAGGAAHLPGMIAAHTWLPVLGVPIMTKALKGIDSLLSIAQMPAGVPVGTLAIGEAGARNAGLLAASIIGLTDANVRKRVQAFRKKQTAKVLKQRLP